VKNPLIAPILAKLKQHDGALSEYELIKSLDADIGFPVLAEDPQLALFQKHFLVKNALFQLQLRFWQEDKLYLSISALAIQLEPARNGTSHLGLPGDAGEAKVRDYYLDWQHYTSASPESVADLLADFWRRYAGTEQRDKALEQLGLPQDASPQAIKQHYRRLASQHHPDKGGDSKQFIALRQAYETLRNG